MTRTLFAPRVLVLLCLFAAACEPDDSEPLGFTVQIDVEIDGQDRGAHCIVGNHKAASGDVSLNSEIRKEGGFRLTWQGEAGFLRVGGTTALDGGRLHLFQATFDRGFALSRSVQAVEGVVEGHDVRFHVQGLANDTNCKQARPVP
jgi:hypothetical protein